MAISFDELVRRAERNPIALAQLAVALVARGDERLGRELANRATELAPADPEIRSLAGRVLSRGIAQWHFDLPFDRLRNAAYDAALSRAVTRATKVLEIGTGTGLLAMMAARAGATEVVTCEAVPAIAATAAKIVARNGYSDRVRILAKHSDDIDANLDLGGPADILVSEILANDVVGEGVLPTIEKAKRRLLKPDARIIPARAIVRVALAQDIESAYEKMSAVEGFDLSAFNGLAPARYRLSVHTKRLILRSDPADLFVFDFQNHAAFPEGRSEALLVSSGGKVNCILQWLRCEMDDVGSFENHPGSGRSSWALDAYPLLQAMETRSGEKVKIHGAHDRNTLRCWIAGAPPPPSR